MKFINYLEKITGVDVFALTSLTIFFTFFVVMAIWVATADKRIMDEINHLPLDN
ncbi:MAG: CcoQ/FixQ family Cbb3-type cytochrome c oxidase assembly chaperone [Sediminibacterium sp.]|jgi:hypothetical protein|nr:MAG: CcoQ/FixQ family Cbb3-type cytochrome c oxidase assembly chaperone [Sediminibacterium sp.]